MTTATTNKTTTYRLDKAHSEAVFQVRHLLTKVRGRFSDFEGEIDYDEELRSGILAGRTSFEPDPRPI